MDGKSIAIGFIIGIIIALASAWAYLLMYPSAREAPIPPRIEFITTDLNTCTVDYIRSEFCQQIMSCSYEDYPSIIGGEYWCICHQ